MDVWFVARVIGALELWLGFGVFFIVLADDDALRLNRWLMECPSKVLPFLIIMFWPVLLAFWFWPVVRDFFKADNDTWHDRIVMSVCVIVFMAGGWLFWG